MKTYRLNFIRHGVTQANLEGRYCGRTDHELCLQGIQQLIQLKEECLYPEAQRLYASPLTRCVQTAGILYPNVSPTMVPELIEMDFGEFEGKTMEELRHREDFAQWVTGMVGGQATGGESWEDFTTRLIVGVERIFKEMMEDDLTQVSVVTHGGVIMTLMHAVGLPKGEFKDRYTLNGRGFSVLMTPQMWMRDRALEICGTIPVGCETIDPAESIKFLLDFEDEK